MSHWKECKLGELVSLEYGKSLSGYQESNGKYPVYGTNGKIGNTDSFLSSIPSVIIGRKGAYRGVHFSNRPFNVIDTAFYIKPKTEYLDLLFLFNFLLTQDINAMDSGSAIPSTDRYEIYDLDILLPPLPEQHAIAGVLSSLDDKIDLLHRQNKTLEAMAEAVFRQWFIEEGNNSVTACLNDYVSCFNGVSYKSSELNPSKTAMVTLKSFNRHGGFSVDGFKEFTGKYKVQQIVIEGDLVVAHTDITQEAEVLGNPALIICSPIYDTLVISMDLVKVVPKMDCVSKEFLYFLMRSREFKHHCLGCANGTTVLHLNKEAIPTFEFSIPDKGKVIEFTKLAKDLIQQVFIKHRQIRTLSCLRDTLLPKLMSGEVRVKS